MMLTKVYTEVFSIRMKGKKEKKEKKGIPREINKNRHDVNGNNMYLLFGIKVKTGC